jgi:hypothetical protein
MPGPARRPEIWGERLVTHPDTPDNGGESFGTKGSRPVDLRAAG